jgi:hypothetical protein
MGKDSSVWFGLGTYQQSGDTIIEHNLYNSSSLDTAQDLKLIIKKTASGYQHEIPEIIMGGTKYSLKEEYDTISINGVATPIDGLWERGNTMMIKGTDTSFYTLKEYLIFQSGHYLKASRRITDSAMGKISNDLQLGTFNLTKNVLDQRCDFSNDVKVVGLKINSFFFLDEKKGLLMQTLTNGSDKSTHYITYSLVK